MRHPHRYITSQSRIDASSAGDERDHDVRRVPIEVLSSSIVDRGCARVSMTGSELHVTQRDTGVEGGHDERSTKHVRVDVSEACSFADRSDPAVRGASIESGTVTSNQDWSVTAFADGQVNGPGGSRDERDYGRFVALADDPQCPVAAVESKIIDVGVACFAVA